MGQLIRKYDTLIIMIANFTYLFKGETSNIAKLK